MGPPPGDPMKLNEKLKEPKPKTLKEVPGYLFRVCKSLGGRLLYIFGVVWNTRPWILFCMIFMAVFNGVMPVIGLKITANLLTALQEAIAQKSVQVIFGALFVQFGFLVVLSVVANL